MTDHLRGGFERRWAELEPIGRDGRSGGYRRFAWTRQDAQLREWFAGEAAGLGLELTVDRAGNQWAWWGDPDAAASTGDPGVVTGSHLDSVPDGGAFDGPLGVLSALTAVAALQAEGFVPGRPIGVVNFVDEEGARFGVACAGSRVITGAMTPDRARALRDGDGVSLAEAMAGAGQDPVWLGRDDETLRRIGTFIELHVEQGVALALSAGADGGPAGGEGGPAAVGSGPAAVGVADAIWAHGRWRFDFTGQANHAGTTRLADRRDPMLEYARLVLAAREVAQRRGAVATVGKVLVDPNGVNAIPSLVRGWLDARAPGEAAVRDVVRQLTEQAQAAGAEVTEESWTPTTGFDRLLRDRLAAVIGKTSSSQSSSVGGSSGSNASVPGESGGSASAGSPPVSSASAGSASAGSASAGSASAGSASVGSGSDGGGSDVPAPIIGTGAGHDAGILAAAGVRAGMLFVRNPTGVSHSPAEHAELADCLAGVEALRNVIRELAS